MDDEPFNIASREDGQVRLSPPVAPPQPSETAMHAAERYERGLTLKKAGLYNAAIEQFEQAARDPAFALRAYAKIGLCYKSSGMNHHAVTAFRKALKASARSPKETVQVLYVLGRTLESLGHVAETLEAYRWIRREDPLYRDVARRIDNLSSRRLTSAGTKPVPARPSWVAGFLKSWQDLLKLTHK